MLEIVVRSQKCQVVPQAQSSQKRVDGADLNPATAAGVFDFGSGDAAVPGMWALNVTSHD